MVSESKDDTYAWLNKSSDLHDLEAWNSVSDETAESIISPGAIETNTAAPRRGEDPLDIEAQVPSVEKHANSSMPSNSIETKPGTAPKGGSNQSDAVVQFLQVFASERLADIATTNAKRVDTVESNEARPESLYIKAQVISQEDNTVSASAISPTSFELKTAMSLASAVPDLAESGPLLPGIDVAMPGTPSPTGVDVDSRVMLEGSPRKPNIRVQLPAPSSFDICVADATRLTLNKQRKRHKKREAVFRNLRSKFTSGPYDLIDVYKLCVNFTDGFFPQTTDKYIERLQALEEAQPYASYSLEPAKSGQWYWNRTLGACAFYDWGAFCPCTSCVQGPVKKQNRSMLHHICRSISGSSRSRPTRKNIKLQRVTHKVISALVGRSQFRLMKCGPKPLMVSEVDTSNYIP